MSIFGASFESLLALNSCIGGIALHISVANVTCALFNVAEFFFPMVTNLLVLSCATVARSVGIRFMHCLRNFLNPDDLEAHSVPLIVAAPLFSSS